jgi:3-phenylpropionate/cinnamic acid dioxygenase small subunit
MTSTETTELARLREQVQELLDRQAIHDVVLRYARGLDRHDHEIYASVYHEDGIDRHGEFIGRRDEFVKWGIDLLASEWDAHTHFITNHRVDIDGDVAHSECYALFAQRRRDRPVVDIGGARYIDRLERRNGEWRVAARECVIEWTAEANTTTFGGAETYRHGTWDRTDPSYERPFELPDPETVNK